MNNKAIPTSFKKGYPGFPGEKNGNWKGDKAGYNAIHDWMRRHFGKPQMCEHCGVDNKNKYEWANISKKYKRAREDWLRLCTSCHRKFDNANRFTIPPIP